MPLNANQAAINLPLSIIEPVDVNRMIRELGLINEHLYQAKIRDPNQKIAVKTSAGLTDLLSDRGLDISNDDHRRSMTSFLTNLQVEAPVIHISFGAEPSHEFVVNVAKWCRSELHPTVLLVLGLDRSIGVGCIVRTPNKVFDLSLKERLKKKQHTILDRIKETTETVEAHG